MDVNSETARKLREMGAAELLDALKAQDDGVCMGMTCAERVQMAVDEAHSSYISAKVRNLTKRAGLRYPEADARSIDFSDGPRARPDPGGRAGDLRVRRARRQRRAAGADRHGQDLPGVRAGQGRVRQAHQVVLRSPARSRGPVAREPRAARRRAEARAQVRRVRPARNRRVAVRAARRAVPRHAAGAHGAALRDGSTVFCTQFRKKDWHARLGGGVHADAITDRIVHNATWVDMGDTNMRQRRSEREREES